MKAPNSVFFYRYKMPCREIQNKSLQLFHLVKKCLLHCATRTKKTHKKNPIYNIQYTGSMIKKNDIIKNTNTTHSVIDFALM